jgi:hypothetical protein
MPMGALAVTFAGRTPHGREMRAPDLNLRKWVSPPWYVRYWRRQHYLNRAARRADNHVRAGLSAPTSLVRGTGAVPAERE